MGHINARFTRPGGNLGRAVFERDQYGNQVLVDGSITSTSGGVQTASRGSPPDTAQRERNAAAARSDANQSSQTQSFQNLSPANAPNFSTEQGPRFIPNPTETQSRITPQQLQVLLARGADFRDAPVQSFAPNQSIEQNQSLAPDASSGANQSIAPIQSQEPASAGASGFGNILPTIGAALAAPFNGSGVVGIDTGNAYFDSAVEYLARNPYSAALILGSLGNIGIGVARGVLGSIGKRASVGLLPNTTASLGQAFNFEFFSATAGKNIVVNTVTARQAAGVIAKISAASKFTNKAFAALLAWGGPIIMGEWGFKEAKEQMELSQFEVIRLGDPALMEEWIDTYSQIMTMSTFEKILRFTPFNPAVTFPKSSAALATAFKISVATMRDEMIKLATGTTDAEVRVARMAQEAQDFQDASDYRAQQKVDAAEIAADLRKAADEAKTRDETRQRNADAAFWDARAKDQAKQAEADRRALADFWNDYRQKSVESGEDLRKSNLNFGLL